MSEAPTVETITPDELDRLEEAKRRAAEDKRQNASVKFEIEVDADLYGMLTAASVIHNCSVAEVTAAFLGSEVCEWSGNDYALEV